MADYFSAISADQLNADNTKGELEPTEFTRTTGSISFYDSVVAFEKANVWWKDHFRTGADHKPR
jgi:hypothetical protein